MADENTQISTGIKDSLLNMLMSVVGDVKIDFPGDRAKLKALLVAAGEWIKTVTTMKWDLDDIGYDRVVELLEAFVDSYKQAPPAGPVLIGAAPVVYTAADVKSFFASFPAGTNIPVETRQKMLAHPKVLAAIKKLSPENQITVMNRQDLMDLLIKWGPTILNIVLAIISFI
jgi:hypothetical protein